MFVAHISQLYVICTYNFKYIYQMAYRSVTKDSTMAVFMESQRIRSFSDQEYGNLRKRGTIGMVTAYG